MATYQIKCSSCGEPLYVNWLRNVITTDEVKKLCEIVAKHERVCRKKILDKAQNRQTQLVFKLW